MLAFAQYPTDGQSNFNIYDSDATHFVVHDTYEYELKGVIILLSVPALWKTCVGQEGVCVLGY